MEFRGGEGGVLNALRNTTNSFKHSTSQSGNNVPFGGTKVKNKKKY